LTSARKFWSERISCKGQALPWRVFFGYPACMSPVSACVSPYPWYPAVSLYRSISSHFAADSLHSTVCRCIQLYPYVSSCIQLYLAVFGLYTILPYPYCMVNGIQTGGRRRVVHCAKVLQSYYNRVGDKRMVDSCIISHKGKIILYRPNCRCPIYNVAY